MHIFKYNKLHHNKTTHVRPEANKKNNCRNFVKKYYLPFKFGLKRKAELNILKLNMFKNFFKNT